MSTPLLPHNAASDSIARTVEDLRESISLPDARDVHLEEFQLRVDEATPQLVRNLTEEFQGLPPHLEPFHERLDDAIDKAIRTAKSRFHSPNLLEALPTSEEIVRLTEPLERERTQIEMILDELDADQEEPHAVKNESPPPRRSTKPRLKNTIAGGITRVLMQKPPLVVADIVDAMMNDAAFRGRERNALYPAVFTTLSRRMSFKEVGNDFNGRKMFAMSDDTIRERIEALVEEVTKGPRSAEDAVDELVEGGYSNHDERPQ